MASKSKGREERLAEALRANLKRRKARQRVLADADRPAAKDREVAAPAEPRQNKDKKER